MQEVGTRRRIERLLIGASALAVLALLAMLTIFWLQHPEARAAADFDLYRSYTRGWLDGQGFYQPFQLAGPYSAKDFMGALYPPVTLLVLVPFTVLPDPIATALWFAIPIGVTAWVVVRLRPRPYVWPLLAACVLYPWCNAKIVGGNPVIWAVAAEALAVLYRWPGPFVLLKPSLFPFALVGIRSRGWWMALALFVVLCAPFGTMWLDWTTAVLNERTQGGLFYSLIEVPLMCIPIIAWVGRRRATSSVASTLSASPLRGGDDATAREPA